MINKDIQTYAMTNWNDFIKTVSELSKGGETGRILADNNEQMYCFDSVCSALFPEDKKPSSADCICFQNGVVTLIEFKSGFKDIITNKGFDREKGECKHLKDICNDYWDQFRLRRDKEKEVLQSSILMKAIESYVLLEKKIMPLCATLSENRIAVRLLVVIDEDGTDGMLDILSRQSGDQSQHTVIQRIKDSLRRLNLCQDGYGNDYYYDKIDVLSAIEFKKKARQYAIIT